MQQQLQQLAAASGLGPPISSSAALQAHSLSMSSILPTAPVSGSATTSASISLAAGVSSPSIANASQQAAVAAAAFIHSQTSGGSAVLPPALQQQQSSHSLITHAPHLTTASTAPHTPNTETGTVPTSLSPNTVVARPLFQPANLSSHPHIYGPPGAVSTTSGSLPSQPPPPARHQIPPHSSLSGILQPTQPPPKTPLPPPAHSSTTHSATPPLTHTPPILSHGIASHHLSSSSPGIPKPRPPIHLGSPSPSAVNDPTRVSGMKPPNTSHQIAPNYSIPTKTPEFDAAMRFPIRPAPPAHSNPFTPSRNLESLGGPFPRPSAHYSPSPKLDLKQEDGPLRLHKPKAELSCDTLSLTHKQDVKDIKTEGLLSVKPESHLTVKSEGIPSIKSEGMLTVKTEGLIAPKHEGLVTVKPEAHLTVKQESSLLAKPDIKQEFKHERDRGSDKPEIIAEIKAESKSQSSQHSSSLHSLMSGLPPPGLQHPPFPYSYNPLQLQHPFSSRPPILPPHRAPATAAITAVTTAPSRSSLPPPLIATPTITTSTTSTRSTHHPAPPAHSQLPIFSPSSRLPPHHLVSHKISSPSPTPNSRSPGLSHPPPPPAANHALALPLPPAAHTGPAPKPTSGGSSSSSNSGSSSQPLSFAPHLPSASSQQHPHQQQQPPPTTQALPANVSPSLAVFGATVTGESQDNDDDDDDVLQREPSPPPKIEDSECYRSESAL